MILYKYYGLDAGMEALVSRKLGFRKPAEFNDPFELTAFSALQDYATYMTDDGPLGIEPTVHTIMDGIAICSLSRSPIHPLMWSHYADAHRGIVIGYEVDIPLLNEGISTLIPVQDGSVFYSHAKDSQAWTDSDYENLREIFFASLGLQTEEVAAKQMMRRLLLNKSIHWAYEEEVRIVKILECWNLTVEEFFDDEVNSYTEHKKVEGLVLYDQTVPIASVYLGCRTRLKPKHHRILEQFPLIYEVVQEQKSWELTALAMDRIRKREIGIRVRSAKGSEH